MTDNIFRDNGTGGLSFVGDFEGLYQRCSDPWGQSGDREAMRPITVSAATGSLWPF